MKTQSHHELALLLAGTAFIDIEICPPFPPRLPHRWPPGWPPRGRGWPWPCPPPPWETGMMEMLHQLAPDASLRAAAHVAVAHVEHLRQAAQSLEHLSKSEHEAATVALVKGGIAFSEECGTLTRAQIVAAIMKLLGRKPPPLPDPDNPGYRGARLSANDIMLYDAIMIAGAAALTSGVIQQVADHSLARFSSHMAQMA